MCDPGPWCDQAVTRHCLNKEEKFIFYRTFSLEKERIESRAIEIRREVDSEK